MAKIGRNEPCPCGSGRKYKRCCIGLRLPDTSARKGISDAELLAEHRRVLEDFEHRRIERAAKYGLVRPIISMVWQGTRFVAVGSTLHWSKSWKTVPDFLSDYIKRALGEEWRKAETKKPLEKRHPILQWYDGLCRFQLANADSIDESGLFSAEKDGVTAAYYQLAYDLYVLADHQKLQEGLVRRLKDRSLFQGARHELAVATHCIIAGFDLEHEDESDKSTKHPEFLATHRATGQVIAVEAKSRHRPGVLGQPGDRREQPSAGVRRILHQAREKAKGANVPFAVFVDLNLPPTPDVQDVRELPWINELAKEVTKRGEKEENWYNLLMFTNRPQHYGAALAPNPTPGHLTVIALEPKVPVEHPKALQVLHAAAEQYGRVPNRFEE